MYEIRTLNNGLRVVFENIDYIESVTVGIWIKAGSAFETRANNGVSHYMEHMLFKGTHSRSAKEIAAAFDNVGGHLNAYTGTESTCFYAKVLQEDTELAFDVLSDMLLHSKFDQKDLQLERSVILEEIGMYNDSPEDVVNDLLLGKAWAGNSLCYPVLGTKKSLSALNREDLLSYYAQYYVPENAVLAVVGHFNPDIMLKLVQTYFGRWKGHGRPLPVLKKPAFHSGQIVLEKDIEQTHLCIGYNGFPRNHPLRQGLTVVNTILGGNMSSRLFQKVREELGLAYSVYSYQTSYTKAGLVTLYAGMNPSMLAKVAEVLKAEVEALVQHGLSAAEIEKAKHQLKCGLAMSLEDASSRMNAYGQALLLNGEIRSIKQLRAQIDRVDTETVRQTIAQTFTQPCIAIVQGRESL